MHFCAPVKDAGRRALEDLVVPVATPCLNFVDMAMREFAVWIGEGGGRQFYFLAFAFFFLHEYFFQDGTL